ncbi:MAG TPA: hypothetical protein VMU26_07310 [Candidatus Polarisedimenticolia bacterium]|nr:hypothetical protein [Candidatus Polarisedimenticolia bacterium]
MSGRTGQQYNRTAFVLCDDCVELASKLFLLTDTSTWSDQNATGGYKGFRTVTREVGAIVQAKRPADHAAVEAIRLRMEVRRDRRNTVFHSTTLLDLNFYARDCVEAFCDLLDYGKLLFPSNWDGTVAATGNMETCEAVIRVDKKVYGDPSVTPRLLSILKEQPRFSGTPSKRGCEVVHHPEDYHLRLCIRNGGKGLRNKLRALLTP